MLLCAPIQCVACRLHSILVRLAGRRSCLELSSETYGDELMRIDPLARSVDRMAVWYDNDQSSDQRTLDGMMRGVRESMTFLILLSGRKETDGKPDLNGTYEVRTPIARSTQHAAAAAAAAAAVAAVATPALYQHRISQRTTHHAVAAMSCKRCVGPSSQLPPASCLLRRASWMLLCCCWMLMAAGVDWWVWVVGQGVFTRWFCNEEMHAAREGGLHIMVRKTPLFAPFIYINHHFTKTGSGQA
jgi:hypothetical protein